MDARALIPQAVVEIHNQSITQVDINLRTWPFSIDTNDWTLVAIGRRVDPGHVPLEMDVFGVAVLSQP